MLCSRAPIPVTKPRPGPHAGQASPPPAASAACFPTLTVSASLGFAKIYLNCTISSSLVFFRLGR